MILMFAYADWTAVKHDVFSNSFIVKNCAYSQAVVEKSLL